MNRHLPLLGAGPRRAPSILPGVNIPFWLYQGRRWALLVLLPTVALSALVYLGVSRQPRTFTAVALIYVQQPRGTGAAGGADPASSAELAQTYGQMVVAPVIASAVDRAMAARYPGYDIGKHDLQEVRSPLDGATQLIGISVTDTNPVRAAAAANQVASIFSARIRTIELARVAAEEASLQKQLSTTQSAINALQAQLAGTLPGDPAARALRTSLTAQETTQQATLSLLAQVRLAQAATPSTVTLYSPATPPTVPAGPHPLRTALIVLVALLLLGTGLIYLYDYFTELPRTSLEVSEAAGAPVLGAVMTFDTVAPGVGIVKEDPLSPAAESFRMIEANVRFSNLDAPPRVILVTSALPGEGKSTVALNLAHAMAESGAPVTLIDADLRRPSLHQDQGDWQGDGLMDLLTSGKVAPQTLTHREGVTIVPTGPIPTNPSRVLASGRMKTAVEALRGDSRIVILDSPPVLAAADAAILATLCDAVVLVVDPYRTTRRALRQASEAIDGVGGRVIGVVMNRLRPRGTIYYTAYGPYTYDAKDKTPGPLQPTPISVARREHHP